MTLNFLLKLLLIFGSFCFKWFIKKYSENGKQNVYFRSSVNKITEDCNKRINKTKKIRKKGNENILFNSVRET